ncbi:hypothetical protein Asch01_01686 [Acinetobacter schindleri]|uniref:hypothetical protein n=1 Tax=Acinetobacter schindleri TaxID=108981 RepID=UPI00309DED34
MTKKSKLLVRGDYPLIASPTLAQAYGVPSAMFLQKLHYCLQSKDAICIKQQKFFYHTYENWAETLGIYSVSTIKRIVSKLKKAEILIVKKLAQNKWLQTNFYTINYRKLSSLLKDSQEPKHIDQSDIKLAPTRSQDTDVISKPHATSKLSVTQPFVIKKSKVATTTGLNHALNPIAQDSALKAMSFEKRGLYKQLLQYKVDIHYDDTRIDEWLNKRNYVIQKVAYLKDQLGHMKMLWHTPEQLGLH